MNRIDAMFAALKQRNRPALMPFLTAGDPDLGTTRALITALIDRGASMIEVGIPYSDPIADGPVISESYTRALRGGVTQAGIFDTIKSVRADLNAGPRAGTPLVAMVSYAIIHRLGVDTYLKRSADAGFDGLIVPDLPVEEAGDLVGKATALDLKVIQLITPTTPKDRALAIARSTTGFLYYVSVAGITGERRSFPTDLAENVAWLRSQTDLPVCIGFGIGSPDQVRELSTIADGLIVGSALVRRLVGAKDRPRDEVVHEIGGFIDSLVKALD